MRKLRILGKEIPVILVVSVLLVGVGSATLLTYYGVITSNVIVYQSILLDGKDVNSNSMLVTDVISETAPGGEKFCFKHTLTNQMSVPGTVNFEYSCAPDCTGIETTYLTASGYSNTGTSVSSSGNAPVGVKVEELDTCQVKWTFDFPIDDNLGNGNMGYGLIISTDGAHPAFQIHNHDWDGGGTIQPGIPCYTKWDDTIVGNWHGWMTGSGKDAYQTEVSTLSWVTATGDRYHNNNPTGVFNVTIDKCKLGVKEIWWAAAFGAGGFYSPYGGQSEYPDAFDWGTSDVVTGTNYLDAVIGTEVTGLTIPSDSSKSFCSCYKFAQNIAPNTYTITTGIKP